MLLQPWLACHIQWACESISCKGKNMVSEPRIEDSKFVGSSFKHYRTCWQLSVEEHETLGSQEKWHRGGWVLLSPSTLVGVLIHVTHPSWKRPKLTRVQKYISSCLLTLHTWVMFKKGRTFCGIIKLLYGPLEYKTSLREILIDG